MQNDLEKVAVIVPRITLLLKGGLKACIQMVKPHFLVQQAERMVMVHI
jgi:hypothetical protein